LPLRGAISDAMSCGVHPTFALKGLTREMTLQFRSLTLLQQKAKD